jgi:hypothetical protein
MTGKIEVQGWESAQGIAKELVKNGYEVLISSDGHVFDRELTYRDGELTYRLEFAHPEWEGINFEPMSEEIEGRRWEEIKEELKKENIMEGLEHLDHELPKVKKKK